MRNLARVLATVVVAVSCLAGCNSKSASRTPEEVPATPSAATASDATELPAASPAQEPTPEPVAETKPAEAPAAAPAKTPTSATPQPAAEPACTEGVALISRSILFGNPDKASARISPDGSKISYLAPRDGVLNVFVGPIDDPSAAQPITDDKYRGIRAYFWAYDSQHVLYIQDTGGDEDWHVYSVDLASGQTKDLTPIPKVAAQIDAVSEKFPQEIVVGLNDRDPQFHDVYRVNIVTGDRTLLQKNTEFAGFVTDDDYRVRLATKMTADGGMQYFEPDGRGAGKSFSRSTWPTP